MYPPRYSLLESEEGILQLPPGRLLLVSGSHRLVSLVAECNYRLGGHSLVILLKPRIPDHDLESELQSSNAM